MNPLKMLTQMLKYHRSIDVEKALRWQYSIGYKAGQRDAMKHLPWPSEPHTDPLQPVSPIPTPHPPTRTPSTVRLVNLYNQAEGRSPKSKVLKAVTQKQLADWKTDKIAQEKERQG